MDADRPAPRGTNVPAHLIAWTLYHHRPHGRSWGQQTDPAPAGHAEELTMKRRTLDIMFSIGGLGLAVLLLVVGPVVDSNATFPHNNVRAQLAAQQTCAPPVGELTDEERPSPCLVAYAGQQLTTGKQAECYANEYTGLHLRNMADGKTYAELGEPQAQLREQIAQAEAAGDPAVEQLREELAQVTSQRET